MIAVKRLQSLFWLLLVALGVLGAYLVSLRVATERNELMRVRAQIASARADIRYLETEFSARANMRQLEKWNAEDFRYAALNADHYLDGERALAHLDGIKPNGPAYVGQPVLVAMAEAQTGADAPPVISSSKEVGSNHAVLQIRADESNLSAGRVKLSALAAAVPAAVASKDSSISRQPTPQIRKSAAVVRKAEEMALLDARLLDDRTLGDIGRRAAAEIRGGLR